MGPVDQLEDRHLRKVEATGSKEGIASPSPLKRREKRKGEGATRLKIPSGPFFDLI